MIQLAKAGFMPPEAVKMVVTKMMDIYKFGSTAEFAEAMDKSPETTTETDLAKMKIAVAEVMKDLGMAGQEASNTRIMENKIGVVEGLKDAGMLDQPKISEVSKSITYKDTPPDVKRQIEEQAGLSPSAIPEAQQMAAPVVQVKPVVKTNAKK